ncbi:MerR family transcriptional regulator [bacterium]|nr:MerR family transcriptional regulator [bacterium]
MGSYSIKDLEKLSGIKAHTLRMWESRYGIINPQRTETKIRVFNDEELKKVLNISFLNHNGYKISRIAKMEAQEILGLVAKISSSNMEISNQLDSLTMAMINLDEMQFDKIVGTFTLQIGFERTMLELIFPFLRKIGVLWLTGNINPAHEHFIANLVRQKLIVASDGQVIPHTDNVRKYGLFLPEGELHEISLLFAYYLIKKRNCKAIYLGQNLPIADVEMVDSVYDPHYLLTFITSSPSGDKLLPYLLDLASRFPQKKVLVAGYGIKALKEKLPENMLYFNSIPELVEFIEDENRSSVSTKTLALNL